MSAKIFTTDNIRNVAVIGHSDTGKTSLVSALLFNGDVINRLCKVDDGNTTTDFDEDEHDRKITINTSVAHFEHRETKINLIDAPGYGIYTTDAVQGLRVADTALLLISAVSGVEVQTDKMWKAAANFDLPVLFGINLMDRDRASFSRTIEALQKKYGRPSGPRRVVVQRLPEGASRAVLGLLPGQTVAAAGARRVHGRRDEAAADSRRAGG